METLRQPTESINLDEQMFYDMPRPEIPEVAFGVESEHLLRTTQILGNLATHAPKSLENVAKYAQKANIYGEEILRMAPLIEKVVKKEEISETDVRPYRAVIKDIARQESTVFRWAERATNFLSFFGIRKPKRMLNTYVEKKFVECVPKLINQAVSYVKKKVDTVMNLVNVFLPKDNPNEKTHRPESEKQREPQAWDDLIKNTKDLIPTDIRERFLSAVDFARSVMLQDDSKEEDKESESKTKNTSKIDRKEVLNKVKTYISNRQKRKAQARS